MPRAVLYSIDRILANLIEEEVGESIEKIPKKKLMKITRSLTPLNASLKGIKCIPGSFRNSKRRFLRLISEGKIIDHVSKIRNPVTVQPTRKYNVSLNPKNRINHKKIADILKNAKNGITRYHLGKNNRLSGSESKYYVDTLPRLDLLSYDKDTGLYNITDLGFDFIHVFELLGKYLKGESTAEPVKLDEGLRKTVIFELNKITRKKVYDNSALILLQATKPKSKTTLMGKTVRVWHMINTYIEFLTELKLLEKVDGNKYKTTPLGSQYVEEYLNFILFYYLG